jgi:hypothetical protein
VFGNEERASPARRPEVTVLAVTRLVYFFGRIVRSAVSRSLRAISTGLMAIDHSRALHAA